MDEYPHATFARAVGDAVVLTVSREAVRELMRADADLVVKVLSRVISRACEEIVNGKWHTHFVVDMVQGGAGMSTNMNANEVIANRALELMGFAKGDYARAIPTTTSTSRSRPTTCVQRPSASPSSPAPGSSSRSSNS